MLSRPSLLSRLLLSSITRSAITLRCLRACWFPRIPPRSILGQVVSHAFSLGTQFYVPMLPSNCSAVLHFHPPTALILAHALPCDRSPLHPRNSWDLEDGKKKPLPDEKNPSISTVANGNQVSKKCPVRGI